MESPAKTGNPAPPPPPQGTTGRNPDPQGGRVHAVTSKINVYEADALAKDKKAVEARTGLPLTDSAYIRSRLLNGGEPLTVDYPPAPVDARRERRGSVPRRIARPAPDAVAASVPT